MPGAGCTRSLPRRGKGGGKGGGRPSVANPAKPAIVSIAYSAMVAESLCKLQGGRDDFAPFGRVELQRAGKAGC